MDISKEISAAEGNFRDKLELYLSSIFRDSSIDSHGPEHHRRVWLLAKDLLSYPVISSAVSDGSFAEKLLIGAYLHDSGMVRERGPMHGSFSRAFCEDFLRENGIPVNGCTDLLEAVENHDRKDYSSATSTSLLYSILTAADDLDALGYNGIYRYTEIYLMREIPFSELGTSVIKNINGRFANLEKTFVHVPQIAARYRPALETVTDFFGKYNIQLASYRFGSGYIYGYCGVVETISNMTGTGKGLEETIEESLLDPDRVISWYFGELKRELS